MRSTRPVEFELESGKKISVDVTLNIIRDSNYGADADGNRGVDVHILDDYDFKAPANLSPEEFKETAELVAEYVDNFMDHVDLSDQRSELH